MLTVIRASGLHTLRAHAAGARSAAGAAEPVGRHGALVLPAVVALWSSATHEHRVPLSLVCPGTATTAEQPSKRCGAFLAL